MGAMFSPVLRVLEAEGSIDVRDLLRLTTSVLQATGASKDDVSGLVRNISTFSD